MKTEDSGRFLLRVMHVLLILILPMIIYVDIYGQTKSQTSIRIITIDNADKLVSEVGVRIKLNGAVVHSGITDKSGMVEFSKVAPGVYEISVAKDGFEELTEKNITIKTDTPLELRFVLIPKIELKAEMEVKGGADSPVEAGSSPAAGIDRKTITQSALKPTNVADVLPMVPGVTRSANGEISISGTGEHRSALVVNSADVTDPATGQFGMTIPVDSVEKVEVFKSPFLAQYGKFSSGVVSVETRRGGEKWDYEFHDPLPEFRFRSGRLAGLQNMSPRLELSGPLIKDKLYLSEGIEYRLFKRVVRTLPHPNRESVEESVNSFTQLDYIATPSHTITATAHVAPRKIKFADLNFFDPRPVTPNFSSRDYTGTVIDRLSSGSFLLETTASVKRFGSDVWGQGTDEMILTPDVNRGNYYNDQSRNAFRYELMEQVSRLPLNWHGTHNFRFGGALTATGYKGEFHARPINILGAQNQLLQRIEFAGGSGINSSDKEFAVYGQDQLVINPKLALNIGARMERQSVSGAMKFAPRLGFSWAPFGMNRTVFRGGAGVFYDRVPLSVYSFRSYPERVVTTYDYDNNGNVIDPAGRKVRYTNEIQNTMNSGILLIDESKNKNNFAPYNTTWSVEAEHPFTQRFRMKVNYTKGHTSGLLTVNPGTFNSKDANILSGDGIARLKQLEVTAKVTWREDENMFFSYVRSRSQSNLNEFNQYLGYFPTPVIRPDQFSNTNTDLPHRFLAYGNIKGPKKVYMSPMIEYRTGFPYSVIDGYRNFVGVRNSDSTRFPNSYSVDVRLYKDFKFKFRNDEHQLRLSFYGYNITNHFNALDVQRNTASPQFGTFFGKYRRWFKVDFDIF